jgi:hypothetical protein
MAHTTKYKDSQLQITVVNNMPDYGKDPYFVKKLEKARAALEKIGVPKGWAKKKTN